MEGRYGEYSCLPNRFFALWLLTEAGMVGNYIFVAENLFAGELPSHLDWLCLEVDELDLFTDDGSDRAWTLRQPFCVTRFLYVSLNLSEIPDILDTVFDRRPVAFDENYILWYASIWDRCFIEEREYNGGMIVIIRPERPVAVLKPMKSDNSNVYCFE